VTPDKFRGRSGRADKRRERGVIPILCRATYLARVEKEDPAMNPTTPHTRALDCGTPTGNVVAGPVLVCRSEPDSDSLTDRSRRIWSAGDYDRIARGFTQEAEAFVERLNLAPCAKVLDAATGSGNLAIPAARRGAWVTGLDLVPSLLEAAATRAHEEGLALRLQEGNVEDLPFDDREFDAVLSMFGVMFAARPDKVVAELARVTRPGGQVALANWTRSGFVGGMLAKHTAAVPPPAGIPSPLLWGDEAVIRERFNAKDWDVATKTRTLTFRYPHAPAGTAELFRRAYGPTVKTLEALDGNGRAALAIELAAHWAAHNRAGSPATEVDSEYLEVVATRR
jgi:ubiquinone/menaquinone biosynthesis C-methylase UbiE